MEMDYLRISKLDKAYQFRTINDWVADSCWVFFFGNQYSLFHKVVVRSHFIFSLESQPK